jgi:hypothetical protein
LPELLRQAMLQQILQQQGGGSGPAPNAAPAQSLENGNPKGLIGRILELQAQRPGPFDDDAGQPQDPPRDTNFLQPSSAKAALRAPGSIHLSSRFEQPSNPTYSTPGDGAARGDSPLAAQGAGSFTNRDAQQAPTRVADASMNMTPFAWRGTGIPIPVPLPSTGAGTVPEIPMPRIPDWWRAVGAYLQLYRDVRRSWSGGDDDYNRCMRAAAGDTDSWEELCRHLDFQMSKTTGAQSANRGCWAKTYEPPQNKENWCRNQFGGD